MLEAIKEDPFNIKYVQNKLEDDIDLALMAIQKDVQTYIYLSQKLQQNKMIKAYLPKQKNMLKFKKPSKEARKGAIRGVSIAFLLVSTEGSYKYRLISPPKGMKIIEKFVGNSCTTPYVGEEGNSAVHIKWDVPMDIKEGKNYKITVQGIDKEGYTEEITFPIKVSKTKPIQTKIINNELIVTDKSSNLYGMKMKGHSGEYISELRLRGVDYGDVWRKSVKGKKPEDLIERTVFVMDNMPKALDIKAPNSFDTNEEWIKTDTEMYKYYESFDGDYWKNNSFVYTSSIQYDGITGLVIPYKTSWDRSENNSSKIFMFILGKAQNKGAL